MQQVESARTGTTATGRPNTGLVSGDIPGDTVAGCPRWDSQTATWWGRASYGYNWIHFPATSDPKMSSRIGRIKSPPQTSPRAS